ncbi:MAG: hypothetical protein HRF50_14605 [Phycisphaerae bacterium]
MSHVCREHVRVEFTLPHFPPSHPGQFLQVLCREPSSTSYADADWPESGFPKLHSLAWPPRAAYLRRPFSIADHSVDDQGQARLAIISRAVGPGTTWLDGLARGADLNITGPLGQGFGIPADDRALVLVGGGVGIPPMIYLSRRLAELGRIDVTVIFGALSRELLPAGLRSEPSDAGDPRPCLALPGGAARYGAIVTTDDGSCGLRGFTTDGLSRWIDRNAGRPATVFACGPEAMLRAVASVCGGVGLGCQLCVERNMGCGLGTCLSCVVRVRDPGRPQGWRWALSCGEGPVFEAGQLCDYGERRAGDD